MAWRDTEVFLRKVALEICQVDRKERRAVSVVRFTLRRRRRLGNHSRSNWSDPFKVTLFRNLRADRSFD